MHHSLLKIPRSRIIIAMLALAICAASAQAAGNLLKTDTATVTVTCSTVTGPGTATFLLKPVTALTGTGTGTGTLAVTLGTIPSGITVAPSTTQYFTKDNSSAGITYTVTMVTTAPGCATSAYPAGPLTFKFRQGSGPTDDLPITVNLAQDKTASGLLVAPSSITVFCTKTGSTYTPAPVQTVTLTSAAAGGGTPFTLSGSVPAWLTLNPASPAGTATGSATTFTIAATPTVGQTPGCGGFNAPSTNYATIKLANSPAPDKSIAVTLQVVAPSNLTVTPTPSSGSLTYVKGSGTPGYVDVAVTSSSNPPPFFAVDTTSLPIWLNVDSTSGLVPKSIRFSSNSIADTLAPGSYSANVLLNVSGYAPKTVALNMLVTNGVPKLSTSEGTTRNITWTLGAPLPNPFITLVSSDSPISYSLTSGGTLAPVISPSLQKGLAYSFGTAIPVTFNPTAFAAAAPGNTLTGTVTITWGTAASTIVVTFNVSIVSPGATLTGISPGSIPQAASGGAPFTVALIGTGFVPATDPTQKTKVGIVPAGGTTITTDTNIAVNVQTTSTIILTITVPATADTLLPFDPAGTGGNVTIGVCNPSPLTGTCSTPSATATLTIGSNPIISAVTSASAFLQVTSPSLQTLAPYDLISIFGTNFCSSAGTGCTSSTILSASPDAVTKVYPGTLSPDASNAANPRNLAVTFYQHGTTTVLGTAPLLFATNNQINLAVPAGISAQVGNTVDIVVSFGYGSGAAMKKSAAYEARVVATNPGVFTVGADGQGDGAILDSSWAVISQANPAGMRSTAADSDTVQVFMTGLGVPDSADDNSAAGSNAPPVQPGDCISPTGFMSTLNQQASSSLTSVDGAIIQSRLINTNKLPPCMTTLPTATIGGASATVTYAGWVADSIAGLYQVNLKLPGSVGTFSPASGGNNITNITAPVQLPVTITAGSPGRSSQSNVTIWVAPKLKVVGPVASGLNGNIGASWPTATVVASEGLAPYQYIVTSGVLPSGLSLDGVTGAITGFPALNTMGAYVVTVGAIDSAATPVTGSVTFTLTVNGGLVLSSNPVVPNTSTAGVANANVAQVTAAGGNPAYTYSITTSSLPAGLTISATTGIISTTASTPAWGPSPVTVHAVDSTSGVPLVGNITFTIQIVAGSALTMSNPGALSAIAGNATANLGTVTASGGTPAYTYSMAPTAGGALPTGLTIAAGTGIISTTLGTPVMPSTSFTVTATDSTTGTPRTGTRVVFIAITQGVLTLSNPGSLVTTVAAAPATLATITVSAGGTPGYIYNLTRTDGLPLPTGLSIDTSGNIVTTSGIATLAPTGLTVTVTDSTTVATRQGVINFTIEID